MPDQMIRIASQLTFCSPECILRNNVLEIGEKNKINRFYSLENIVSETSTTLFFDGILSAEIPSLSQKYTHQEILKLVPDYQYIDVSKISQRTEITPNNNPLLIDFGTNSSVEINFQLKKYSTYFLKFSIFEIIAACVYYPAKLLGSPDLLTENYHSPVLLWENVDLVNKKITADTEIKEINLFD